MEQIAPILEQLAKQLGTTVEYLWAVMVRQAHYSAMIDGAMAFVFFVASGVATKVVFWCHKNYRIVKEKDSYAGEGWVTGMVLVVVAGLTCLAISLTFAHTSAIAALNPEYWALREILGVIR